MNLKSEMMAKKWAISYRLFNDTTDAELSMELLKALEKDGLLADFALKTWCVFLFLRHQIHLLAKDKDPEALPDPKCPVCKQADETKEHFFLECEAAKDDVSTITGEIVKRLKAKHSYKADTIKPWYIPKSDSHPSTLYRNMGNFDRVFGAAGLVPKALIVYFKSIGVSKPRSAVIECQTIVVQHAYDRFLARVKN